jgi:ferredoxin
MPTLTIDDTTTRTVEHGTRLVNAIREAGIEIGHRCGGKARCTTCRVEVHEGGDDAMTRAEFVRLRAADLLGDVRLSCQMLVEDDMRVTVLKTKASEGWPDTGPAPAEGVEPEAAWFDRAELERDTPPV